MSSRKNPEGRRRALAAAVVAAVAEVGVGRVTHRMVAARAGVPLGATTYYFPTLADLVAAGLAQVSEEIADELKTWGEALGGPDPAEGLSRLVVEYVADHPKALLEYELYLAAARAPALRPLARAWLDGVHELLAPVAGDAAARAVSALVDGAMLQAVVTGDPIDGTALAAAIRRLMRDEPRPREQRAAAGNEPAP